MALHESAKDIKLRIETVKKALLTNRNDMKFRRANTKLSDQKVPDIKRAWLRFVGAVATREEYKYFKDSDQHNKVDFDESLTICMKQGIVSKFGKEGNHHRPPFCQ